MLEIALAVLARFRISRMLTMEEGMFSIFANLRERIDPTQATWLGRGLNCPLCVSFWVAGAFALLLVHQNPMLGRSEFLLYWLGIAGATALIHLFLERE